MEYATFQQQENESPTYSKKMLSVEVLLRDTKA